MRTRPLAILSACACLGLGGCISDGPAPEPRAQPRDIPAPRGFTPDRMLLAVAETPLDSDGDRYADTYEVTVYLFATRADLPFHADGAFTFTLTGSGGAALAEWKPTPEDIAMARMKSIVGEGYMFRLDLNAVADDRIGATRAALHVTFTPEGAPPASASTSVAHRVDALG